MRIPWKVGVAECECGDHWIVVVPRIQLVNIECLVCSEEDREARISIRWCDHDDPLLQNVDDMEIAILTNVKPSSEEDKRDGLFQLQGVCRCLYCRGLWLYCYPESDGEEVKGVMCPHCGNAGGEVFDQDHIPEKVREYFLVYEEEAPVDLSFLKNFQEGGCTDVE